MARMETFGGGDFLVSPPEKTEKTKTSAKGDADIDSVGIECEIVSLRIVLLASTRFPFRF